ncbi:methyltransferase-like protein 27 isoform X2 [Antennarius striatus]|uniref:methyltransferase-like protein 27 isoform X2 n=1 Tax=Antennarius striatus TaxID=241820 RepID=UPI0035B047CF
MSASSKHVDAVKTFLQTSKGFSSEETVKFYDTWASTYEQDIEKLSCQSNKLVVDCLQEYFSGIPEEVRVLDVACGSGWVAKLMAELGFKHFVGVDGSRGMLEQAARSELYQELKLALLGTQPLPAETGTFDVVILAGGFGEGFVPVSVVRELCNAAKPGGWVCISRGAHSITPSAYEKNLERELKLLEEEGWWRLVGTKETNRYMEDPYVNPEKEEDRFIMGVAYMFRKCTQ